MRKIIIIVVIVLAVIIPILFLNTETVTRQGINYKVTEIKIPLYLKLHNFLNRHLNYQWTVNKIVNDRMTDQQKAEVIFSWTIKHIVRQPSQLPVVDDHPWYIIVRGYGKADQMTDVFAVLSNYAGLKSFIFYCEGNEGSDPRNIYLGAVFFDGAWHLCDIYDQTVFINAHNKWASTSELVTSGWKSKYMGNSSQHNGNIRYENYFQKLNEIDYDKLHRNQRSAMQNPLSRLKFFLKDRKI